MNLITILTVLAVLCVVALFVVFAWSARRGNGSSFEYRAFANVGERLHRESLTKKADAAIGRFLLVKVGTDAAHFALNGATDTPFGATIDETAAAEDLCTINMLGQYPGTIKLTANAAITAGAPVYSAAAGKITPAATAPAGTKFIGFAVTAAAADNDVIEVMTVTPKGDAQTLIFSGIRTWAAGAAVTEGFALAGVLATDTVIATPIQVAGAGLLQKVVPTANTLTATTNANWGNGDRYSYQVWR